MKFSGMTLIDLGIEITPREREDVDGIARYVHTFGFESMSANARMALAAEFIRMFKREIAELNKRRKDKIASN